MVAEKLQEARLSTANPQPSSSPPSPEELRHMADTVEETEMGQETPDEFSTDQYSFKAGRTSRLQQMMNCEQFQPNSNMYTVYMCVCVQLILFVKQHPP